MQRTRLDFVATGRRCAHVALLMVTALSAAGGLAALLARSFGEVSTRADLIPASEGIGPGVASDITPSWLVPTILTMGRARPASLAFSELELIADGQPK